MAAGGARVAHLTEERDRACRLTPDRALNTLDDAVAFVGDRGMLTLTADGALPSLFGACHEPPYSDKPGYGQWPATKWWWGPALGHAPGVLRTKLHRGRTLFLSTAIAELASPLCLHELDRAARGEHGSDAAALVAHLAAAGSSTVEDLKAELGWDTKRLRSVRNRLEKLGAVVSQAEAIDAASGGHRHTAEVRRWDQLAGAGEAGDRDAALEALFVAGVRAAVVAPEKEARRWFSWPIGADLVDRLVDAGPLARPDALTVCWVKAAA